MTPPPAPSGYQAPINVPSEAFPSHHRPPKKLISTSVVPKQISSIQFGLMSPEEMALASHIEVNNRSLYDPQDRAQSRGGPLDPRLGAISKTATCETCNKSLQDCIGHFGYIRLVLPVFHPGYFKAILKILQMICKHCSLVMLDPNTRAHYLRLLAARGDKGRGTGPLLREIWEKSKKCKRCPYCGRANGTVKKTAILKIVHYPMDNKPPSKRKDDDDDDDLQDHTLDDLINVDPAFLDAAKANPDLRKYIPKAADDLNPMRVLHLFEKMPSEDVQLIDMDPRFGRPERLILQYMPVPPLCIRPSVCSDPSAGSTEDDLTVKASEILEVNSVITQLLKKGGKPAHVFESWDHLQYEVARYINSEMPGLPMIQGQSKPLRGVSQRLKGKTGRFRGNLSGKRVDFSGRTVISPDPNLRIDQVGVPVLVAKILTFPERANNFNRRMLQRAIRNGPDKYPGANFIEMRDGSKRFLKYGDRNKIARELKNGMIVERHIIDGDIVLFNRQPSLHRISIMAHRVKISPHRTFRFNECVCAPYNADFDGDEMNLHVPQTQEARAEAIELMGVVNNILTPKNGEPLVAATQDFITASYLVTSKNVFMDRAEFTRVLAMLSNAAFELPLPTPAIIKPMELWTGKQLFTVLVQSAALSSGASTRPIEWDGDSFAEASVIPPSFALLTTEVKEKGFSMKGKTGPMNSPVMCPKDAYVVFRGGELMCGQLGKKTLGDGSKPSILYVLGRECGNEAAGFAMNQLARFAARWLAEGGFSIGVDDVTPSSSLLKTKAKIVKAGYAKCDDYIDQLRRGTLQLRPGSSPEQTLEAVLNSELSAIRDDAGKACTEDIDVRTNAALTMALAGSKGSVINISQMIACVGQQTVGGGRAPDGFFGRALPHFELGLKARSPAAKGFVRNSFFSGLVATEFFMHAQSGREGLTDTAVKTAETGYMQRRLVKALEDLNVQYDSTVRSSNGSLVQVMYGDDSLDPLDMEGKDGDPVEFERVLQGAICSAQGLPGHIMTPHELRLSTEELSYKLESDLLAAKLIPPPGSENEGGLRKSIKAARSFLLEKANEQEKASSCYGLRHCEVKMFLMFVQAKVRKAEVEPGTAVGAIAAQSVGEPGTQMTLKTFHFAGVASMNITQGVPRLKEIINASKSIATPLTEAPLVHQHSLEAARIVKGRVERTCLGELALYVKEVFRSTNAYVAVRLDMDTIGKLQLDIDVEKVAESIVQHSFSKLKVTRDDIVVMKPDKLRIRPQRKGAAKKERNAKKEMENQIYFLLQSLKEQLAAVPICGIAAVSRAVINDKGKDKSRKDDADAPDHTYELLIESDDIASIMVVPGVDGTKVVCNHIMAVEKVLGIEAARYVLRVYIIYFQPQSLNTYPLTFVLSITV